MTYFRDKFKCKYPDDFEAYSVVGCGLDRVNNHLEDLGYYELITESDENDAIMFYKECRNQIHFINGSNVRPIGDRRGMIFDYMAPRYPSHKKLTKKMIDDMQIFEQGDVIKNRSHLFFIYGGAFIALLWLVM